MIPQHLGFPVYQDSNIFPRDGAKGDIFLLFFPALNEEIPFVSEERVKSGKMLSSPLLSVAPMNKYYQVFGARPRMNRLSPSVSSYSSVPSSCTAEIKSLI